MPEINMKKYETDKKTHTYSLKTDKNVLLKDVYSDFQMSVTIKLSGNSLLISYMGKMGTKLKFTNISDLNDINIEVRHQNGNTYNGTFKEMIDYVMAYDPSHVSLFSVKKRNITGTDFNDDINLSDATVFPVDKKGNGYKVNAGKGSDNVTGTDGKDTINGGDGKDYLHGGLGNDKLVGGADKDDLWGEMGDDTLQGGAGDDQLIGGAGNDKLDGGADDDYLYGGIGNDTLTGGKGNDTFAFNANDGSDIITDASKGDKIELRDDANTVDTLKFVKNGNDLEIYSGELFNEDNKIVVKNHFKKKVEERIDLLTDKKGNTVNLANDITDETVDAISGSKTIKGTDGDDIIKGSKGADKIYAYGGNDDITGGAGNDTINAGKGKNKIRYSAGDGNDTILYGGEYHSGTSDTLIFDEGINVSAKYSGKNLLITYTGMKNGKSVTNTITVKNYRVFGERSVEYIRIGDKTRSVGEFITNGVGKNNTYTVSSLTKTTNKKIVEKDGSGDVINFKNVKADDIRLVFDASEVGDDYINSRWKGKTFFAYKDAVTLDKIIASDAGEAVTKDNIKGSVFVLDTGNEFDEQGIETVKINGKALNTEAWFDAVQTKLVSWLRTQTVNYGSISWALDPNNGNPLSEEKKAEIVEAYKSVKYSDIAERTVNSHTETPIELAGDKYNWTTFTGDYGEVYVDSANKLLNGYSDTLVFSDVSFADGTLWADVSQNGDNYDLYLHATPDEAEEHGGIVHYQNFLKSDTTELIVKDKDSRKISVQCYTKDNLDTSYGFGLKRSHMFFANAAKSDINQGYFTINSGGDNAYNYTQTMGGIGLHYTYGSEVHHDKVATRSASDDVYYVELDETVDFQVEDKGGSDKLIFYADDFSDIGIVCNVYKHQISVDEFEWLADRSHVVFTDKGSLSVNSIKAATSDNMSFTIGANILTEDNTGIETLGRTTTGSYNTWYADDDAWFAAVAQGVSGWLSDNGYNSVDAAIDAYNQDNSIDLSGLVAAFKAVNGDNYAE